MLPKSSNFENLITYNSATKNSEPLSEFKTMWAEKNVNSKTIYKSKLKPIQDAGGAKKAPPTSFSPVTSTNVGIGPKKFLTFSFDPFAKLVQNF